MRIVRGLEPRVLDWLRGGRVRGDVPADRDAEPAEQPSPGTLQPPTYTVLHTAAGGQAVRDTAHSREVRHRKPGAQAHFRYRCQRLRRLEVWNAAVRTPRPSPDPAACVGQVSA